MDVFNHMATLILLDVRIDRIREIPALIWLILVFAFLSRFEKALDRMECGKDEYKCLEDEDE